MCLRDFTRHAPSWNDINNCYNIKDLSIVGVIGSAMVLSRSKDIDDFYDTGKLLALYCCASAAFVYLSTWVSNYIIAEYPNLVPPPNANRYRSPIFGI
jgi:hypothetical protein